MESAAETIKRQTEIIDIQAEGLTVQQNANSALRCRIESARSYVEDLDRHGSIDHDAAREILRRLSPPKN